MNRLPYGIQGPYRAKSKIKKNLVIAAVVVVGFVVVFLTT